MCLNLYQQKLFQDHFAFLGFIIVFFSLEEIRKVPSVMPGNPGLDERLRVHHFSMNSQMSKLGKDL